MFGSHVLETFAGLAFIFLLLSVFASTINEWIAAFLSARAKALEVALKNLLAEPSDQSGAKGFASSLLGHSLIQNLSAPKIWRKGVSAPSYISAKSFSTVLFDLLIPNQPGANVTTLRNTVAAINNEDLKKALLPLIDRAGTSIEDAQKNIENWYDTAMDRLSGRYKRQTHWWLFAIGLVLAVAINVDTLHATKQLWSDPVLREHMLEQARLQKAPEASSNTDASQATKNVMSNAESISDTYSKLGVPVGWTDTNRNIWHCAAPLWPMVETILGWLLTAIAVSLGAPFWFDLLNKTLKLNARLNGDKPEKSPS